MGHVYMTFDTAKLEILPKNAHAHSRGILAYMSLQEFILFATYLQIGEKKDIASGL